MAAVVSAVCVLLALGSAPPRVSDLAPNEVVVFYPSYLAWDARARQWRGSIHGKVEAPARGATASAKLSALKTLVSLNGALTDEEARLFRARAGEFLADGKKGRTVVVQIGGRRLPSTPSRANGHFFVEVALPEGTAGEALPFTASLEPRDRRIFGGTLPLIGPAGVSVISDIDDTVKESHVMDRRALLAESFVRPYRAVAGMAELYGTWSRQGVVFHYVTAAPWQLYGAFSSFLREKDFPLVDIQMRHLRLKDLRIRHPIPSTAIFKSQRIREILEQFPERRFVLVGDSGEQDLQIYAGVARAFPGRIQGLFIRAVREEHLDPGWPREALSGVDPSLCIVFADPSALPRDLRAWRGAAPDPGPPPPP